MMKFLQIGRVQDFLEKYIYVWLLLLISPTLFAQPANDDCSNVLEINIPNSGFGLGKFNSSINDITKGTLQTGETFAPAILVAGLNKKSMWYKFMLPTTRAIRVTLAQPGTDITAGDAGFAVYKVNACTPGVSDISTKLTPIGTFGNTFHPCVDSGVYYVQVSANEKANGPLYIELQVSDSTGALYDHPLEAYDFGILNSINRSVNYSIGCHSIEDASEICATFPDVNKYHKSSWHTFTTPAYFDYVSVLLTNTSSAYYVNVRTFQKFGYRLYKGDSKTTPINSLVPLGACDSLLTNGYQAGFKMYKCDALEPNTTYTIQLFAHEDFNNDIRLTVSLGGSNPTQAPTPVLTPSNDFGELTAQPRSTVHTLTDFLACNSRHNTSTCSEAKLPGGVDEGGVNYNLSTFFTFTLTTSTNIDFYLNSIAPTACGPLLKFRLFQKALTANCADFDTAQLLGTYDYNSKVDCLWPGTYTVQVLGTDKTTPDADFNYYSTTYTTMCRASNLGSKISLRMTLTRRVGFNQFSLNIPGAFDSINNVNGVKQPLQNGVLYRAAIDTFGCTNTVLPIDTSCSPQFTKAMYRQFEIADSGVVTFSYLENAMKYRLYSGEANSLAEAQNTHAYPARITSLGALSECLPYNSTCNSKTVCVVPGEYTYATFAGDALIGRTDRPGITFKTVVSKYGNPFNAQDMGSLLDSVGANGGTVRSDQDKFTCKDNAEVINGYVPCSINRKPATKALYRQFYLKESAMVTIRSVSTSTYGCTDGTGVRTLFYGKASEGLGGLTPVGDRWECFSTSSYKDCDLLPAGWYTVVSYGSGPTYDEPLKNLNEGGKYESYVDKTDLFDINIVVCASPKYNRPFKASVATSGQPHLIEWKEQAASSPAYPITSANYTLPMENFNCQNDTPFILHPILSCDPAMTKVAYWVFTTTQETYMEINTGSLWGVVYALDVRKDSALLTSATPVQPCVKGSTKIQLCRLPAGTYTLVVFAGTSSVCSGISPGIYVDQVRESRFDHANKAYDFDIVPPDSAWHYGKVGEVNPLHPNRAASNDFFACTTGSQPTDPTRAVCSQDNIYNMYDPAKLHMYEGNNTGLNIVRRNLWYTFVVDKPGWIRVKADSKTKGKEWTNIFAVYRSDVDGSLPFSQIQSEGLVDSSLVQGLTLVGDNRTGHYCDAFPNGMSFYRDPCTDFGPQRYYILVEENNPTPYNIGNMRPNNQVEVAILVDSINMVPTKYDHHYQAYDFGNVGAGKHTGGTDNYSCATRDPGEPLYSNTTSGCSKTLWYKFTATVTGTVRYRIKVAGVVKYDVKNLQLFREILPGDSTAKGLIYQPGTRSAIDPDRTYWTQNCVAPGTYYIILPGCDQVNEEVFPEIELLEQEGDFCSRPMTTVLTGPGSSVTPVLINCHTIGTDYGEFNPELSCPPGSKTNDYKSSWFRIDITGTDTLDVTTYLTENTNVNPEDIKYRMMTGNCGAMQEESCVMDSRTRNTYKCLTAGSYYIQVFTPMYTNPKSPTTPVTGDISLHLSAVSHVDTCAPVKDCFANANFIPQFDCTKDTSVRFVNYSTYGSSIEYKWDFGFGGQTSTAVSPDFNYPILETEATYQVTLKTINTACNDSGTVTIPVIVPARPKINIGLDTSLCQGESLTLDASTWAGTVYQWNTGARTPAINTTGTGVKTYWAKATYNGCVATDTIKINTNPIKSKNQNVVLCNVDSVLLSSDRRQQEEHNWTTGATSSSIYVQEAGVYYNLMNWNNCLITDTFNVLEPGAALGNDTSICFNKPYVLDVTLPGATYTWQDNSIKASFSVTEPGIYWVSIKFGTCIIADTINISGQVPLFENISETICSGQNYTLPGGEMVNKAGIYKDTIRYVNGCDSLISVTSLSLITLKDTVLNVSVCSGQKFTLPWGDIADTAGIYKHVSKSINGCDSLQFTVNLAVSQVANKNISATICAGENYALPSGKIVNQPGLYTDTIRHVYGGCDSLITTVNLVLNSVTRSEENITLCAGGTFTLLSGKVVSTSGRYIDTLSYVSGCDSIIHMVNLKVNTVERRDTIASVCEGNNYILPSGKMVNTSGVYQDTIKYLSSVCDSLIYKVDLKVHLLIKNNLNISLCSGEVYSLPSGKTVSSTGLYYDTLKTVSGCDSLITTADILMKTLFTFNQSVTICAGGNYGLPSGKVVNTTGVFADTVRYIAGCDSLISITDLTVSTLEERITDTVICSGQPYTLPWGEVINSGGTYLNMLKNSRGCDSIKNIVHLSIKGVIQNQIYTTLCFGQVYTLPSGKIVSSAGTYKDTIRYYSGCDSLVTLAEIKENTVKRVYENKTLCEGDLFTMPSGNKVLKSGVYHDTLRYAGGCDSLVTTLDLKINPVLRINRSLSVCAGQTFTLPSGKILTSNGIYSDTLRYLNGCDSLISIINLTVVPAREISINPSVCEGEKYTMPSGTIIKSAGHYTDIIKSEAGCDSVITYVTLKVDQKPLISLRKSNDISCMETSAILIAGGGTNYQWWPSESLSNPMALNPVASPSETTVYKVRVSLNDNCYSEDSIRVVVNKGNADGSFLLPNSFSPNRDGLNDCFGAKHWGAVSDFKMTIFNRFGNVIFQTTDPSACWDGSYKGRQVDLGVYTYQVSATTICGPVFRKGTLSLLR